MYKEFETIVIGGGLVGSAVASGIACAGRNVAVLDGGDQDFRASRGNFGLAWVQGKGADNASYAKLNGAAGKSWSDFNRELLETTGIDIGFHQPGGIEFCLDEDEWELRSQELKSIHTHTNGDFTYEMLEHSELKKLIPHISKDVLGGSYSSHDGHLNPLFLLRALHQRMTGFGCEYFPMQNVTAIDVNAQGFNCKTESGKFVAEQIVLCAGLDNERLARFLGMKIPVHPIRGQLLITERVEPFLNYPTLQIRQTDEGTVQIGWSHEDVGRDDGTTLDILTELAGAAVKMFPHLHNVNLNRAWGALRVMTPDGLPIYHQSEQYPGAFALSCHSGVTLAVIHAQAVAKWICGDNSQPLISDFSADRFSENTYV